MIEVREAQAEELMDFQQMDRDHDTREHITHYSLADHRREFARAEITYLSIREDTRQIGYFILAADTDAGSVEFRRIVIAEKGRGYGQAAIAAMEAYCVERWRCERIWLDVYETNPRGRHIYRKLGYRQFDSSEADGRKLLYMEKKPVDRSLHRR